MDDLDIKNINNLLKKNFNLDVEAESNDENDLEDELEAILNGKIKEKRPKVKNEGLENLHEILSFDPDNEEVDDDLKDSTLLEELNVLVGKSNPSPRSQNNLLLNTTPKLPAETSSTLIKPPVSCIQLQNSHFMQNPSEKSDLKVTSLSKAKQQMPVQSTNPITKEILIEWRNGYRLLALQAKKADDKESALLHLRSAKKLDSTITTLESYPDTDLSNLDVGPPDTFSDDKAISNNEPNLDSSIAQVKLTQEDAEKLFNAPPPPSSIGEGLQQRLEKFKQTLNEAEAEQNTSKVRRIGRIVKNYETAIKAHKSGKSYDYASLPVPPGFSDLPLNNDSPIPSTKIPQPVPVTPKPSTQTNPSIKTEIEKVKPILPKSKIQDTPKVLPLEPVKPVKSQPPMKKVSSIGEKQLSYLQEKQRLFKEAALESKKNGDIQQAKEYLRSAKGFDPLIEATKNGLPIDASSIPEPPQEKDDFVMISKPCDDDFIGGNREESYRKLQIEFEEQISMCISNKEHFLKLGDVSSAQKFEKFAADTKKDLSVLLNSWQRGDELPKFHYENKHFSIVVSNTDLANTKVLVEILRAIDLPGKNDLDTFVKVEFPFPKETPQTGKTHTIRNTREPVYNQKLIFDIDRKSRSLARCMKKNLKCEIYIKGGLFRSDQLLGSVLAPLSDFENKCQIFDSFPLMHGRKAIGGQLQLRIKIREPLFAKQIEEIRKKWLLLD